jgi:hypothetical protein
MTTLNICISDMLLSVSLTPKRQYPYVGLAAKLAKTPLGQEENPAVLKSIHYKQPVIASEEKVLQFFSV